ncbi:hypothetical protein KC343_g1707 [Hortaea werneckii]|nr:hypothetical protein KC352_g7730 [Hortaea werneckii]KAI7569870.1 hypothetical protein KC317_g2947 [Hortaea werneckii]KAI7623822.1 hypothetical protein KC346_g2523 [Hortaea werneckii]KAI7635632.1 hypothetical protein KC343_g1707 [Hortaea werneckii]KAI7681240.1 hypothetical protein KC319_g1701 [Hortaea werneckii]
MDRLNSPACGPAQQQPRSTNQDTTEGRQSFDSQRLRLRKKRSYNNSGVRNASQPLPAAPWPQNTNTRDAGDYERARRGALRNVVRRIFGRRSKEFDSQPPAHTSPPRHGYHRSEPPALSIPTTQDNPTSAGDSTFPHRTLSAPVHHVIPQPNLERQRSPYAVEFPHSARLKPLTLANPFTAPGSQLRRRKTLPSLFIPDNEAPPPQTADDARGTPNPHLPPSEQTPTSPGRHANATHGTNPPPRTSKRKSRSVGDLKFFQRGVVEQTSPRKKNEELRIWRDSIQGYKNDQVLRASGFTSAMFPPPPPPSGEVEVEEAGSPGEDAGDDRATTPTVADPFPARAQPGRAATAVGDGYVGFLQHRRASRTPGLGSKEKEVGTEEISLDLEDRVARLEAGLQHFQLSLRSLTSDRSPGPVVPRQARTSSSRRTGGRGVDYARTPSMLADTLAADFLPSKHHHQQQQPGSSVYDEDDDHPLHRFPSSSPLNYYYHHRRSSTHDPLHRPETPQTPPLLRGSALSSHYRGNAPGARPSMPPFPRSGSTATMTEDGHNEDEDEDEEVNFPFPAQSASFAAEAEAVGMGGAVDSPSELPGGAGTSSRKRRKESAGFHFPFPPSLPLRERRELEEEEKEGKSERQLHVDQDQHHQQQQQRQQLPLRQFQDHQHHQDQRSELSPPRPSSPPHQHHHPQPHQQSQDHTFKSLYQMLADERSARRNLEGQLRGLRREIRDLHWQVSSSSSPASLDLALKRPAGDREGTSRRSGRGERGIARSGGDVMVGSHGGGGGAGDDDGVGLSLSAGQLRGFPPQRLRTAFTSPDGSGTERNGGTSQPQRDGDPGDPVYLSDPAYHHLQHGGSVKGGVISRFSGSESEAGGGCAETVTMGRRYEEQQQGVGDTDEEDELMTPLEAYQTPREEARGFGFRGDGGVF